MATINNFLYSIQNMSPALLSVGLGKNQNYSNLAELSSLWNNTQPNNTGELSSNPSGDKVSFTYKNIGDKIINEMAAITAGTIKESPELDGDYIIAIIDDGINRDARVYSRKTVFDNFKGTVEEKEEFERYINNNPLMVFQNDSGLPDTENNPAYIKLADNLSSFLNLNKKTLNSLDKAGYDPLADMLTNSTIKKIIVNCANNDLNEAED